MVLFSICKLFFANLMIILGLYVLLQTKEQ